MVGGSSTSSKSPRSTSPFRSIKGSPSPFSSPAVKNVAGRPASPSSERPEFSKPKENVTVTVRFRPLSAREMKQGNEIAWYADGDCTVRNEVNPNIAYAFDRVFGPATTTRHVYDIAAHHVVSGAMEGINGTIFAYGVTSSGKTHTMHGLQKSPGIIPLAVKDVFEIIQETPGREFLLRVSYLEIYNEVINDLLDPAGQSLRIREDTQGTYIEGIKDEVVLSPAHALSLIATGEAHRHVGSNNFNLLSSRSHTIFTLTIESSPHGQSQGEEDVSLSQLHLIDLAGSESSKIETNGLRRKEGSYINKSLLTLGTVISKLTDGKASHIPYRDSKLTRLLQSSLSGHGRISLICTVTPASGHSEETHNTLKFAHRSKHVEIKASQNKILDEKSLIKKYQKEILSLKQELQTLKHGIPEDTCVNVSTPEDLVSLKLQLEAGQAQLQSSTEEEEQARAALTGRIQRLTKLILVSTRNTPGTTHVPQKSVYTRRHSFGEEELAHLPDRTRENAICCDDSGGGSLDPEVPIDGCVNPTNLHEIVKDYKKSKRKGMLGWFKSRKPELVGGLSPVATDDGQSSTSGSPATASRSSQNRVMASDVKEKQRKLVNRKQGDLPATNFSPEKGQTDEFLSTGIGLSHINLTGTTITDQLDVLQEQLKLLAGEVAQCTYSLKRLSGEAINSPENSRDEEQIRKLKNEITEKKLQIHQLEQCIKVSLEAAPQSVPRSELSQALAKIATQLSEKTFELEINSVDKRILREQLQMKISENAEMQEAILLLRQQLSTSSDICSIYPEGQNQSAMLNASALDSNPINLGEKNKGGKDSPLDATTPTSVISLNRFFGQDDSKDCKNATNSNLQISNIENLKQENARLAEEKVGLEIHSQKLAEEASYAKELAAAAAIELQHLTEEVTRLSYQNAELIGELGSTKEVNSGSGCCQPLSDVNKNSNSFAEIDASSRKLEYEQLVEYLQNELHTRYQREAMLEAALSEKEQVERELDKQLSKAKRHEEVLESDLENLWVLIENMRKSGIETDDVLSHRIGTSNYRSAEVPVGITSKGSLLSAGSQVSRNLDKISSAGASNLKEIERSKELEKLISRLKGEDLSDLDMATLEKLQNVHVEAITKICQAKCANHIL
ncbi:kinesin-like protein KIN-7C, mitochondrial isoform X2 [Chenopodium quinoa]|uniref:kinesin-like protein KIN-7C, mitochondrial isoform X2 n=1 Tax=Chenopodium quinoa TaxID=63459 RepID=UPI000B7919B9|nr:kinesin-like protein KIN-7C, mitochondrial isoform X2 [Chenopodium quinoa]